MKIQKYFSIYTPEDEDENKDDKSKSPKEKLKPTKSAPEKQALKTNSAEPPAQKTPEESKKTPNRIISFIKMFIPAAIALAVCVVLIAVWSITHTKSSNHTPVPAELTEEEKTLLGMTTPEEETQAEAKKQEEHSYSSEYQRYLELSDEEKAGYEAIPRKFEVPFNELDHINNGLKLDQVIPTKFDLRDKIDITMGNQGSLGLCWDFAASTSLETHLALRGIAYNPSEIQVAYLSSNKMYGSSDVDSGGEFRRFVGVASTIGTISEENTGYHLYDDYDYLRFATNPNPTYVTKTVVFPALRKENGKFTERTEEEAITFRNSVKAHIMQNGSVWTATHSPRGAKNGLYCPTTTYTGACVTNHAMSIIGWDDDYSKENFTASDGSHPEHDGAYIIQNSWGTTMGDGYHYYSYDDYDIETNLSGISSTSISDLIPLSSISSNIIRQYIQDYLQYYIINYHGLEYISEAALSNITYLDLSGKGLTDADVSALSIFPKLYFVDLSDNNLTDASVLDNLPLVNSIELANNHISDISYLCERKEIYALNISGNPISDVSCLSGMETLYRLYATDIPNLTGYEKLTQLYELSLSQLDLADLSPFANLSGLYLTKSHIASTSGLIPDHYYDINFSGSTIDDLSLLSDISIYSLSLSNTGLSSMEELPSLKVSTLNLSNNHLTDLSHVANFPNLYSLNLSNNQISDLSELSSLPSLRSLSLDNNGIIDLSILNGQNFPYLSLANNQIATTAEFSSTINGLNLSNCGLSSLDFLNNVEGLKYLDVSDNPNLHDFDQVIERFAPEYDWFSIYAYGTKTTPDEVARLSELAPESGWSLYGLSLEEPVSKDYSNGVINLAERPKIRQSLMCRIPYQASGEELIKNGTTTRPATDITVIDPVQREVEINSSFSQTIPHITVTSLILSW